jgi:uncharacterized protein (TIGR02145 family)
MFPNLLRLRLSIFGLVFGLVFLCACGERKVAGVEAGNATIAGVVLDSLNNPMEGVEVTLAVSQTPAALRLQALNNASGMVARDTTNSKGEYSFTSLVVGEYNVRVAVSPDSAVETAVSIRTENQVVWVAPSSVNPRSSSSLEKSSSACTPVGFCGSIVDTNDGQVYKTVRIGLQVWMAENLRRIPAVGNSWCYNDMESNCATQGRLYNWDAAIASCPATFHLPDTTEWNILRDYVIAQKGAAVGILALKEVPTNPLAWASASDPFGFSMRPNGYRNEILTENIWYMQGDLMGWFWSSVHGSSTVGGVTDYGAALYFGLSDTTFSTTSRGIQAGLSVRCLQ